MKKFKPNIEAAQKKQDAALELLEQGIKDLSESGNWEHYLKVQSRFHRYSFGNVIMILSQHPNATHVAGYRAWQDMGRQVRKGEKAITILAPIIRKVEDKTGEDVKRLTGFKGSSVFDISQTEGDELPDIHTALNGDDAGLINELLGFATSQNIPVCFKGCLGPNGICHFSKDGQISISVESQLSRLHQCKTLAHELGHALMHGEKEYRLHNGKSQIELEAESVAFMVLHHFGLDSGHYSFAYVLNWSGGSEEAIAQLKVSGQRIQSAAHQVINWVESQLSKAEPETTPDRELIAA
jgi:antirestriction protein ArdC